MRGKCEITSFIFSHPFTSMFFIAVLTLWKGFSPAEMLLSIVMVCFLPLLPSFVWAIKRKKSVYLENRKERHPFLLISSLLLFTGNAIGSIFNYSLLYTVSLLYGINTLAIFFFNFKIKPSIHIAGISGPVTYLSFCIHPLFSFLYLFSLPVAYARLKLRAHSKKEVLAGFFISIFVTLLLIFANLV